MVDHIRTLLLNPSDLPGYRKVTDVPSETALALFGITSSASVVRVDTVLPLALAPDLITFRRFFDPRLTPQDAGSVYRQPVSSLSPAGLYEAVLGKEGWWSISGLFQSTDPAARENLQALRDAAACKDAPYALGAVLLACAYRRLLLQEGGV